MKTLIISLMILLFATSVNASVPASETIRQPFTCNGSTTEFTFTMPCYSADDVYVYTHIIATGVENLLTVSSEYTIESTDSDYLNGGVVTTVATYASTYRIVIVRSVQKTQETVRAAMSAAEAIAAVDKLTRIVQDLQDRWERSIHLQESDATSFDMELPGLALRAGTYMYFGDDGAVSLTDSVASDNTVVSTFMETVVDKATGLAALTTLGGIHVTNIKTFGAVGDGLTDETVAIELAIAATPEGGMLYVPVGYYKITTAITVANGIHIKGDGRYSVIYQDSEVSNFIVTADKVEITDLTLASASTTADTAMIEWSRVSTCKIEDVYTYGGYTHIWGKGAISNEITRWHGASASYFSEMNAANLTWNVNAAASTYGIRLERVLDGTEFSSNSNIITNPVAHDIATAISIIDDIPTDTAGNGESDNQIIGGVLEACGAGIKLEGTYGPVTIIGTHMEVNSGYDIQAIGCGNVSISDLFANSSDGCSLEDCTNTRIQGGYLVELNIDSDTDDTRIQGTVIRRFLDHSASTDAKGLRYNLVPAIFGADDNYSFGRKEVANKLTYVGNDKNWSDGESFNGATVVKAGTDLADTNRLTSQFCYKITGNGSNIYGGIRIPIDTIEQDQWVTIECWVRGSASGTGTFGIFSGDWLLSPMRAVTDTWERRVSSFKATTAFTYYVFLGGIDETIYVTGIKIWHQDPVFVYGEQPINTAVTATAGGATTGLIPSNSTFVTITCDNAAKQVTLPAAIVGMKMTLKTPATGVELICVTAGNKINDVICGGTNEAALVADSHYVVTCISSTEWILVGYDKLGAHIAPIVPNSL